jgi:hypothetical protein
MTSADLIGDSGIDMKYHHRKNTQNNPTSFSYGMKTKRITARLP